MDFVTFLKTSITILNNFPIWPFEMGMGFCQKLINIVGLRTGLPEYFENIVLQGINKTITT